MPPAFRSWPECQIFHPGLCHCTLLPLTGSGPELPLPLLLPQLAGQAKCVWHEDVFYFSCSLRACLYVRDSRLARCRSAAHVQSPVILRNRSRVAWISQLWVPVHPSRRRPKLSVFVSLESLFLIILLKCSYKILKYKYKAGMNVFHI